MKTAVADPNMPPPPSPPIFICIVSAGAVEPLLSGGLRRRLVGGHNGRIRLTLIFDTRHEELKIFVHEAAGLPGRDILLLLFIFFIIM